MKRAVGDGVAEVVGVVSGVVVGGGASVVVGGGSVVVGGACEVEDETLVPVTGGEVVLDAEVVGDKTVVLLTMSVPVTVATRVPRGAFGSAGLYSVYIESGPHVPDVKEVVVVPVRLQPETVLQLVV